jgi:RNA polymerase sigma-70 factor (ECF subfamily)
VGEPSDGELLQRALQGDPGAFCTLIRRHDRYLYRIARSVLLDDYEAEDVVQETFVRAFTRLQFFRGEASLRTWLTRIARNEAIRRWRRLRSTVDLDALQAAQEREPTQILSSPQAPPDDPERAAAALVVMRWFLEIREAGAMARRPRRRAA